VFEAASVRDIIIFYMKQRMNMNKQQALPELPESQATGRIREIYDEIKHYSAVPMVALIYRHMATLPGVLEWAWEVLRPLMVCGLLQEKGWQLARTADLPQALAIPPAARQAAGISAADEATIATSLAAFNRTNPINILSLRCLAASMVSSCCLAAVTGDA
jgi:hypothetical protein